MAMVVEFKAICGDKTGIEHIERILGLCGLSLLSVSSRDLPPHLQEEAEALLAQT